MSRVDLRVRILLTFLTDMITTMLDDSYGGLEENKRKTYACLFLGKWIFKNKMFSCWKNGKTKVNLVKNINSLDEMKCEYFII